MRVYRCVMPQEPEPVAHASPGGEREGEEEVNSEVESTAHPVRAAAQKRARCHEDSRTLGRVALRVATYILYDRIVAARDAARVAKVLVEAAIDEAIPPPPREEMSIARSCAENLLPCGLSSLAWFLASRMRRKSASIGSTTARGLWIVVHRILRQALICRLFFERGSLKYNLASLLGVLCTFFRESLFREIHHLSRWPVHFDPEQGMSAVFRTAAYTVSFLLPLQNWCRALSLPQRRSNAKKLLFAFSLANARGMHSLLPVRLT